MRTSPAGAAAFAKPAGAETKNSSASTQRAAAGRSHPRKRVMAVRIVAGELGGGLLLSGGFLPRLAALGIGCVMLGAILLVHSKVGFFMNWGGTQKGEGFEYHLLALGLAIALLIKGGGALSVDGALAGHDVSASYPASPSV